MSLSQTISSKTTEPFKSTDIGDFPKSWDISNLGDLFDLQQGKALSQKARTGISPRPFLRTINVLWGRVDLTFVDQMDFTEDEFKKLSLKKGDLLVCEGGEIGRSAVWNLSEEGFCCQNHVHRLRRKTDGIIPEFVMFWLQAGFLHLRIYGGVGNKTTIPNLSGTKLKQLLLPVPPLQEQKTIAAILSKIQDAIEIQEKVIAKLRKLKTATMAKLFREGLRGEPLKQTEIGEIPESWSLRKIASLGNLVTGTTPATNNPEYYGSDVPFISPGDIGNYRIVRLTGKNISTAGVKVSRPLPFRTVLVVCIGSTIGKVGMTTAEISCTNQQINAIICNETVVPEFVHYLMLWNTDYIRNLSTPSPVPILSKGAFGKGTVACPTDVLEQKQIAKILCAIDDRIETAEAKCNKLGSIFSSMLSLLMTGRVRITGLINSRNLIFNKQDAGRQL